MSLLNISGNGEGVKPVDGDSAPSDDLLVALGHRNYRLAGSKDCYGKYYQKGDNFEQCTAHEEVTLDLCVRAAKGEIRPIGLHPITPDNRCLWAAGDIDFHDKEGDDALRNRRCALAVEEFLREAFGLRPLVCDSNGKGGFHIRVFFKKSIPAEVAYWIGKRLNAHLQGKGFPAIEWFPKQPGTVPDRRYGNWIRCFGRHHKRDHWARVLDGGEWLSVAESIRTFIAASAGDKTDKLLRAYEAARPKTEPKASARTNGRSNGLSGTDRPDEATVRDALGCLPESVRDNYDMIHSGEILSWLKVGMALHSWDQDRGLDLWIEWSKDGPRYEVGCCEKKWQTFHAGEGGLTIASVFKLAGDHGWKGPDPLASFKERPGLEDTLRAMGSANGDGHSDGAPKLSLEEAAKLHGGVEEAGGKYQFSPENAVAAAAAMGHQVELPFSDRKVTLKETKDRRLLITIPRRKDNREPQDWATKGKRFERLFGEAIDQNEILFFGDDLVRHLVDEGGNDAGWVINSEGAWHKEPLAHAKAGAKQALSLDAKGLEHLIGCCVNRPWKVVNRPFQSEYPEERTWNRNAPQLAFDPIEGPHPTWDRFLAHLGAGLDLAVKADPWCRAHGVKTGAGYLKLWIALAFRRPDRRLPYLYFYSEVQGTGKSTFHLALMELVTGGVKQANNALKNQSDFNGELKGVVIAAVEEVDLNRVRGAIEKVKNWTTHPKIEIHPKNGTPYDTTNYTHWVHTGNKRHAAPIFPGDTRIVFIQVGALAEKLDPDELMGLLRSEGPAFTHTLLDLELPDGGGRLQLPVLETGEKRGVMAEKRTPLEEFIAEHCDLVPGYTIPLGEFYDRFKEKVDPDVALEWTKIRVGRNLPDGVPSGKYGKESAQTLGNICWKGTGVEPRERLVLAKTDYLRPASKCVD